MPNAPHFQTPTTLNRLDRLRNRRVEVIEKQVTVNEVYARMASETSSAVKYAIGSMQPIDPEYTRNTYKEAERVKDQLEKNLATRQLVCDYEYQGSVSNDTHIFAKSDIDLLTLYCGFVTLDPPQKATSPYQGDPVKDLLVLRQLSTQILEARFPQATVDSSRAKSVSIEGGSLRRKVDVVASNWCDTCEYARTRQKRDRAINILDAHKLTRPRNMPFLHNALLDEKDRRTLNGLRKAIRLLKSLKYDADTEVKLSSYDICAIVYNMSDSDLIVPKGAELVLVRNCNAYLDGLNANRIYRESLDVPDGTRKIFGGEGATVDGLNQVRKEVSQLQHDIENELSRSFRKLAEARIAYA